MGTKFISLTLIVILSCGPLAAYAESKCAKPPGEEWGCFGLVELKFEGADGGHSRMVNFKNGDVLLELKGVVNGRPYSSMTLMVEPLHLEFSRGDDGAEVFALVMQGLATQILKSAYPSGPDSVPEGKSIATAKLIGNDKKQVSFTVSTARLDRHRIKFAFPNPESPKNQIEVAWDSQLQPPLPDGFSVTMWKNSAKVEIHNLGEARALCPDYKGYTHASGYSITLLDNSYESSSEALALNNAGVTAGSIGFSGVLWNKGKAQLLDTPGGKPAKAHAVNDAGEAVGVAYPGGVEWGKAYVAAVWRFGTFQDLETLGGKSSEAYAINNAGYVAGSAQTPAGRWHAVLWKDAKIQDLDPQGTTDTYAYGINNKGEVVGTAGAAAVIWSNGSMQRLSPNQSSSARGINDRSQVVGSCTVNNAEHAVVWTNGKMEDLDPRGELSIAIGINNLGQVVGSANAGGKPGQPVVPNHAFLWSNGTAIDLDTLPDHPGWEFGDATAINDKGEIAVVGFNGKGQKRAFLLSPISAHPAPLSSISN